MQQNISNPFSHIEEVSFFFSARAIILPPHARFIRQYNMHVCPFNGISLATMFHHPKIDTYPYVLSRNSSLRLINLD